MVTIGFTVSKRAMLVKQNGTLKLGFVSTRVKVKSNLPFEYIHWNSMQESH